MSPEPGRSTSLRNRWVLVLLAVALCAGVAICLYLTRFHEIEMYGDQSATLSNCPRTETTNCEVVNTSAYSEVGGVPISALGIPTYLLLLGLLSAAWSRPRLLALVFSIGLLLLLYSAYLYYVSTVEIGFLCAWCFRLYLLNASVPILSAVAAWRNPLDLLGEGLDGLRRFRPPVRLSAAAYAALLVLTIAGDRLYRATLLRPAAASSSTAAQGSPAAAATPAATPGGSIAPFVLPAPLKRVEGRKSGVVEQDFDLQSRIGRGRPVALIFWAPGYTLAETELGALSRFIREQAPQCEVFAVAGRVKDQRLEMLWERFRMLDLPADLPLLIDEDFKVATALDLKDVPEMALLDAKGVLVSGTIKGLGQTLAVSPRRESAEEVIRLVGGGAPVAPIGPQPPFYPGMELYGRCAPAFTLPEVVGGRDSTFTGRSANGRPTFLIFWSASCKHCQKEIPQILRHVRAHPDEANIVSVALIKPDQPDGMSHRKMTEAYIRMNGIPWKVLDDSSGFASDLYRVVSTPTTFLINPAGTIVDAWYHPHQEIDLAFQQALARVAASGGECRPEPAERPMPAAFSMIDPAGQNITLDSIYGRPLLVHLWATWCVPCRTELPHLLSFGDALSRRGGRLVLVSVEGEDAGSRILEFGRDLGPTFASYRNPHGGLADLLDLGYSVPRTFLVSKTGSVIKTFYGAQKWEDPSFQSTIRDLLQVGRS
jgi:thiol-disulfide isomerase/thioredoxin/uncharacterized membrane protein